MKQKIHTSAPGKIILLGEHSVVYGKPAIIAAIDKRCHIELIPREDQKITISSKNYNTTITTNIKDLIAKFQKAQKDWDIIKDTNDTELLKSITQHPLDYAQIIIGQFLASNKLSPSSGFDLIIDSKIPPSSGTGSSAALAVSIIAALFIYTNQKLDKDLINEIALLAEQKKHGFPSGGDNTASVHGGLIWFHKKAPTSEIFSTIPTNISPKITDKLFIIFTGQPLESTGELVSKVRSLYQKNPEPLETLFEHQEKLVHELLAAFKNEDEEKIIETIKKGEKNLEQLGVVSSTTKSLIRQIEEKGGAAKICGAGGAKKGSGILLAYHPNPKTLSKFLLEQKYDFSPITLGAEGVRIEP